VIQEGIAVDPLLARAGWNLAISIQTQFAKPVVPAGHKKLNHLKTKMTSPLNKKPVSASHTASPVPAPIG